MKSRIEELANNLLGYEVGAGNGPSAYAIHHAITTAVNEAIELAARECETLEGVKWNMALSGKPTSLKCSEAIRKLKIKEKS